MVFLTNSTSISYRINFAYQYDERSLVGTSVETAFNAYNSSLYSLSDLNTLRTAIISYQDGLTGSTDSVITKYNAANRFLTSVQLEFVYQLTGNTAQNGISLLGIYYSPYSDISDETDTMFGAIQTAMGNSTFSEFNLLGIRTPSSTSVSSQVNGLSAAAETAIGNASLNGYNLLNNAYTASNSLAEQFNSLTSNLQSDIGTTQISPTVSVTVKSCIKNTLNKKLYALNSTIYTTSPDISTTLHNVFKASKWIKSTSILGIDLVISLTGEATDCRYYSDKGDALVDLLATLGA